MQNSCNEGILRNQHLSCGKPKDHLKSQHTYETTKDAFIGRQINRDTQYRGMPFLPAIVQDEVLLINECSRSLEANPLKCKKKKKVLNLPNWEINIPKID